MLLPSKEVYVGQEADTFRSQNPNHAVSTLHHLHDPFSQLFLRLKIIVSFWCFVSAVGAIPSRRQESLHHHCSVPPEEAPLGQSDSDSPVCSGPSSERPLTGNHPVEEVRIRGKFFFFCHITRYFGIFVTSCPYTDFKFSSISWQAEWYAEAPLASRPGHPERTCTVQC